MSTQLSPIERHLNIVPLSNPTKDTFVNASPLWRPGSRGIFGGIAIGQSLRAAQATVEDRYHAHSMHCSFVFPGKPDKPITYSVERVRDGRSFCTRCVRATQDDRPIFIANISFATSTEHSNIVQHAERFPSDVPLTPAVVDTPVKVHGIDPDSPYINRSVGIRRRSSSGPQDKRIHQWIRARGSISSQSPAIHLGALAFMSDSYLLAAVPHSHGIWHFVNPPVTEFYPTNHDIFPSSSTHIHLPRPHYGKDQEFQNRPARRVAMMVSLDHTIYFHNQNQLRVDDWLLAEIHTSWAGDGRCLMHQKIWSREGVLFATCIQEVGSVCSTVK